MAPIDVLTSRGQVPSVDGGAAYVDGAQILLADVDASNGVIHVIDAVLLPGS